VYTAQLNQVLSALFLPEIKSSGLGSRNLTYYKPSLQKLDIKVTPRLIPPNPLRPDKLSHNQHNLLKKNHMLVQHKAPSKHTLAKSNCDAERGVTLCCTRAKVYIWG